MRCITENDGMSDDEKQSTQRRRISDYILPTMTGVCIALVGAATTSRTWGDSAAYFLAGLVGTGIAVLVFAVARRAKLRNSRANRKAWKKRSSALRKQQARLRLAPVTPLVLCSPPANWDGTRDGDWEPGSREWDGLGEGPKFGPDTLNWSRGSQFDRNLKTFGLPA
jgi:hypothetical protein